MVYKCCGTFMQAQEYSCKVIRAKWCCPVADKEKTLCILSVATQYPVWGQMHSHVEVVSPASIIAFCIFTSSLVILLSDTEGCAEIWTFVTAEIVLMKPVIRTIATSMASWSFHPTFFWQIPIFNYVYGHKPWRKKRRRAFACFLSPARSCRWTLTSKVESWFVLINVHCLLNDINITFDLVPLLLVLCSRSSYEHNVKNALCYWRVLWCLSTFMLSAT